MKKVFVAGATGYTGRALLDIPDNEEL